MRLTCLHCKNSILVDDSDAGQDVECPRCRGTIAVPELERRRRRNEEPVHSARWMGRGVTSLVLGLLSVPGAVCCGLGGICGGIGLILGIISLRTPSRGSAIAGSIFSVLGIMLSLGMVIFIYMMQTAMLRPVVPALDGVQPPFNQKF